MIDMKLRVWKEKIWMVLHLRSLGEETLASRVYREQVAMDWPGLARETRDICRQLEIEDCNVTTQSREQYKKVVNDAVKVKDEQWLREQANNKTKCDHIMKDGYGKKDYMSKEKIGDTRQWYRTRVGLLPFAGNYSKNMKFANTEWMCRCREAKEEEKHITSGKCPVYSDIRDNYGELNDDEEMVCFLREVLERRDLVDMMEEA
jgi:hypothetical protein